ncbi:MAG: hypothetical protein A3F40_00550 [Chlamydiae bacterium RIFCSPHIGHO2_12_FULL_27_8]|nr:MAG: hypothetical protein A3F40_00550 [Chlamydiae bacterium RIFCSPHIGHO2_12_FULL_27_8]
MYNFFLILVLFFSVHIKVFSNLEFLCKDFEVLENSKKKEFYKTINHNCQAGYFNMPSAKNLSEGSFAFSMSNVNPYTIYGLSFSCFNFLELSYNYWIFNGILEKGFGHLGFNDDADRAANFKIILNDSKNNSLPNIAIGMNDFFGSKRFCSSYIVLTKDFNKHNLELSLGFGKGRINGLFYSLSYFPTFKNNFINNYALIFEYDANDYMNHKDEHPKGKKQILPLNVGVNFNFLKNYQVSLSTLRGKKISFSISTNFNLGKKKSYSSIFQLDHKNHKNNFSLKESLENQFDNNIKICKADLHINEINNKKMHLEVFNKNISDENIFKNELKKRLLNINLENIDDIKIVSIDHNFLYNEINFKKEFLENKNNIFNEHEIDVLSKKRNFSKFENAPIEQLVKKEDFKINFFIKPKVNTFLSSIKGKLKFDSGLSLLCDGYFLKNYNYFFESSYIFYSRNKDIGDRDVYNPSRIINVRSDYVNYLKKTPFHIEKFYLQRNFNLKKDFFLKTSLGFFEVGFAGISSQFLYNDLNSRFAISFELSNLYKRKYSGMKLTKKIRRWENEKLVFEKFIGFQYFFDVYFNFSNNLYLKTSLGQFLALDKGIRFELFRKFENNLKVSGWISISSKNDIVNNRKYYDKGISISIPLNILVNKNTKENFNFNLSEWQRDISKRAFVGKDLFDFFN